MYIPTKICIFISEFSATNNSEFSEGIRRCTSLNEHVHHAGLRASPACACGYAVEDSRHFLIACPRFAAARAPLQLTLVRMNLPFRVEVLLTADSPAALMISPSQMAEIANAVRRYVTATKRFA